MKVTVSVAALKKAMTVVKPSLSRRPICAYDCVQIAALDGSITVTAADTLQGCAHNIPATVGNCGVAVVNFKALNTVLTLKSLAANTVTLTVPGPKPETLEILPGNTTTGIVIPCRDRDIADFPLIPKARKESVTYPISQRSLAFALAAAETNGDKPALCGVHLDADGSVVGTDSYRLYVASSGAAYPKVTVQQSTAKQIVKAGEDVVMRVLGDGISSLLIFQAESTLSEAATRWWCEPVANFPEYKKYVTTEHGYSMTVDRDAFLSAAELCSSVFVKDDHPIVRVTLISGHLLLEAFLSDGRSSTASIDADYNHPDGAITGFTASFLRDVLAAGESGQVRIEFDDHLKPFYFFDAHHPDNVRILMPVNLNHT